MNSIKAHGKTNLESGLALALERINGKSEKEIIIDRGTSVEMIPKENETTNIVYKKAMFIFSDGIINAGKLTDKISISRCISNMYELHDIEFSSFGIGSEYDEQIMNCICSEGNGYLYHITNSCDIPPIVSGAFGYLQKSIATEVSLTCHWKNQGSQNNSRDIENSISSSKIVGEQIPLKIVGEQSPLKITYGQKTTNTEKMVIGSLCKDNEYICLCEYVIYGKENDQILLECQLNFKSLVNNEKMKVNFNTNVTIKKYLAPQIVNQTPETIEIDMQRKMSLISNLNSTATTFIRSCSYNDAKPIIETIIALLKKDVINDTKYFDQKFRFNQQLRNYTEILNDIYNITNNSTKSISNEELIKKMLSTKSETNNGSTRGGGYLSVKNSNALSHDAIDS